MGAGTGFADGALTLCGAAFQRLRLAFPLPCPGPATPADRSAGLGSVRFRSPLLTESLLLSLPPATEMFHFAGFAPPDLWIRPPAPSEDGGLPHSETPGSKTACVSPGLFAACRVLHRLPPPRHPPCARTSWTPGNRFPAPRTLRGAPARAGASAPWQSSPGPRSRAPRGLSLTFSAVLYLFLRFQQETSGERGRASRRGGPPPYCPSGCQRTSRRLPAAGKSKWWSRRDSTPRHPACKAGALPTELRPLGN